MHSTAALAAGMLEAEEGRRRSRSSTPDRSRRFSLISRCAACLAETNARERLVGGSGSRRLRADPVYGALATLTYVARTGRVPALLAGISNTLRSDRSSGWSKVAIPAGSASPVPRGRDPPLERVAVDELGPDPQWLMVFHADAPDEAADWLHTRPIRACGPDRDRRPKPDVRCPHGTRDDRLCCAPLAWRRTTD